MRALRHPGAIRAAQIVLGILFGWAALAKLADLSAFALQVHNFRLLPIAAENLVAMLLPWVELVAALSLVLRIRPRAGAWVAGVLLALFTVGVALAMARGLDFECGCFGKASSTRGGWGKLAQNLGSDDANFCNEKFGTTIDIEVGKLSAGRTVGLNAKAADFLRGKYPALLEEDKSIRGVAEPAKLKGVTETKSAGSTSVTA